MKDLVVYDFMLFLSFSVLLLWTGRRRDFLDYRLKKSGVTI